MKNIFLFLFCMIPFSAYASGDPVVIYFFFGATFLQLLCFVFIVFAAKRNRRIVALLYLVFFFVAWLWALNTRSLSYNMVGWIMVLLPIAITVVGKVFTLKRN